MEKGDFFMNNQSQLQLTKKIIQTALFIALALVVRNFSTMIYFLGAPGMRITFAPIFSRLPALLFGPFFGGIAGGLTDIIAYLLKPEGAYLPLMTVTAILDGVITGFIWIVLKNADTGKIQRVLWVVFISIGAIGTVNYITTTFFPQSPLALLLDTTGKNKGFLVLGLIAIAIIGLILLLVDFAIQKKFPHARVHKYYLKLLVVFGVTGVIITTLNTWILQLFIPELGKMGFIIFLVVRLVKEVFMMVILSYIVAFLLSVLDRMVTHKVS